MKDNHVTFTEISDLYDDLIATEEEREALLDHIDSCAECSVEFEHFKKTMCLVGVLKNEEFGLSGLAARTVILHKKRAFRSSLQKALPALAASLLIIAGTAFFQGGFSGEEQGLAKRTDLRENEIGSTEKIVNIIRDQGDGKIVKITGNYVEGEITIDKFLSLRRTLAHKGFQKVKYGVVSKGNLAQKREQYNWMNNIEEVGAGNNGETIPLFETTRARKKIIHFKVYK